MTHTRRVQQLPLLSTNFTRRYGLMSESVVVETNDQAILAAADASFGRFALPDGDREPLLLRVLRDARGSQPPEPSNARLSHRIDGHRYLVGGSPDMAAVDAQAGVGISFLSAAADDPRLVRYSFIEGVALAMLTYGRGYFSIHAAGVAMDGAGVALVGREGAGKSTLAVAAARRGLDVFAEDAVFVRAAEAGLEFWGLPWTQRLVPDARRFFPEFARLESSLQPNGEEKLEIDLDEHFPGRARSSAHPAGIVMLDRRPHGPTTLETMASAGGPIDIMWPWGDHWTDAHAAAAELLAELPVHLLTMNGTPDEAIDHLELLLSGLAERPTHR